MREKIYGIWIPGKGWLHTGSSIFADPHKDVAEEVARCYGKRSIVRYVDESITNLESAYLECEKENLWHILTSFKIFKK